MSPSSNRKFRNSINSHWMSEYNKAMSQERYRQNLLQNKVARQVKAEHFTGAARKRQQEYYAKKKKLVSVMNSVDMNFGKQESGHGRPQSQFSPINIMSGLLNKARQSLTVSNEILEKT